MRVVRMSMVLLVVALCAACSRGEAAVPEGFVTAEKEVFTVSHPEGWERVADQADALEVRGPVGEADIEPALTVVVDRQFAGDFDHAVDGIDELGTLTVRPDRELVRDTETDVDGAEQARFLEATWVTDADGVTMRAYDLFARTSDDLLVYLSITAPESAFDEELFMQIIDSFEVR